MLRWIVLLVLLCDGIYFVWQRYLAPQSPAPAALTAVAPQGKTLQLIHESSSSPAEAAPARAKPVPPPVSPQSAPPPAPTDKAPAEKAPATVAAPKVSAAPICHMIGPFHEKISARQVLDRLRALPLKADLYQIDVPAKPVYWVYLGPMRNRDEAEVQHRQLLARHIESFIITEGPLANGVSLGFFTRQQSAETMLRQRRDQGFDAHLKAMPRTNAELWLVFGEGQYAHFTDAQWQSVQAGTEGIGQREALCDVIASAQKLE